jgi:hypothetical protein
MIEIRKIITMRETVFSELGSRRTDQSRGLWEWSTAARASTQCSENRRGRRSAAETR